MILLCHSPHSMPQTDFLFPLIICSHRPPQFFPIKASTSYFTFHSHIVRPHRANQKINSIIPHFPDGPNIANASHFSMLACTTKFLQISLIFCVIPLFQTLCIAFVFTRTRYQQGTRPAVRPTFGYKDGFCLAQVLPESASKA